MKWYRKLYLGEKAKEAKYKIFGIVKKRKFSNDTYFVVISENINNQLEIVPYKYYLFPHFKKKEYDSKIFIVGLAKGEAEAMELVRQIVDDTYQATGGVDVAGYLNFGKEIRQKVE